MNILLPTDFSENATLAAEFAFDLAQKGRGTVHVLNAYDLPYSDRSMTTALLEVMKENAEKNMEAFEKKLRSFGTDYTTEILLGNPIRLIKEKARDKNIDLVVMGTKGASGLEEVLIGSNAASVIHNVTKPVLIVPPKAKLKAVEKMIFATDFELENDRPALQQLRQFAQLYEAKIDVVHVQKNEGSRSGSRQLVEEVLHNLPHEYTILHNHNIEEAVTQEAEKENADMIVSIAHRYGFFEGLFHRSISSKLAYHTHLPLLVLTEPKK
jgi:nucleotide-binding universal stress UspA family protein